MRLVLLDKFAQMANDIGRQGGTLYGAFQSLNKRLLVKFTLLQAAQTATAVIDRASERLVQFMSQPRGHFTHGADPAHPGQF